MADNLKIVEEFIEEKINNQGGAGSIKAEYHNRISKETLQKAGRYTGLPYIATLNGINGAINNGVMSFNGQAMNTEGVFVISLSVNTSDMNPVLLYLDLMVENSIIHFKDYEGRSVFYTYQNHVLGEDAEGNSIVNISVKSVKGNTNFVYTPEAREICTFEFFTKGAQNNQGGGSSEKYAVLVGNETLNNNRKDYNIRSGALGVTVNIDNSLLNEFSCILDNAFEQMYITIDEGVVFSGDTEGKTQPFVIPKNGNVWIYKSGDVLRIKGDII